MAKRQFAVYQLSDDDSRIRDMYFMDKDEIASISADYDMVATIRAEDLEQAFTIGNIWKEDQISMVGDMRSISVGDIIHDLESDKQYVVARFGFEQIEMKEAA